MQIACTVRNEIIPEFDRAGRPYTLTLTHYHAADTGQRIRTRCRAIKSMDTKESGHLPVEPPAAQVLRRAPIGNEADINVFLDADQIPAIRESFGYSRETERTTTVLAVGPDGVSLQRLTPAQFDARYTACALPRRVAAHALRSIGRAQGITPEARRYVLFHLNAPTWQILLSGYELSVRAFIRRLYRNFA